MRGTVGAKRRGIEQAEPALSATAAGLVVAAHPEPGRGGEQRYRRIEQLRLPGRPVVAMRAAGAAGDGGRTALLAVVIVADMDHQVGPLGDGARCDRRERPSRRIGAILRGAADDPAPGIAD